MGTSPYVCCPGCVILEDDFNRAAIGCRWITASGSWSIVSNQLKANSTGFIYTQAQHDLRRRNVSVKVKNVQAGKVYRLAAAVAEDGRDYLYVELSCGSGGQSTLRLGTLSGGVIDEYAVGLSAGGNYRLFACLTDEGAFGGLAEVSAPVWGCVSFHGPRAGIVNLGNAAEYDDFGFYQHAADSPGDSRCQTCMCDCNGHCLPKTLTVTLESTCQHRDGLTCTLNLDKTAYQYFVWRGETEWPEPLSPNVTASYQFRMFCPWGVNTGCDEGEFVLCVVLFHGNCSRNTSAWVDFEPATAPLENIRTLQLPRYHFFNSTPSKGTQADDPAAKQGVASRGKLLAYVPNSIPYMAELGVWLHVYADTFAHNGFSGWYSPSVNKRLGKFDQSPLVEGAYIGHSDTDYHGHEPDLLSLPKNRQMVERAIAGCYDAIPSAPRGVAQSGVRPLSRRDVQASLGWAFSESVPKDLSDPGAFDNIVKTHVDGIKERINAEFPGTPPLTFTGEPSFDKSLQDSFGPAKDVIPRPTL